MKEKIKLEKFAQYLTWIVIILMLIVPIVSILEDLQKSGFQDLVYFWMKFFAITGFVLMTFTVLTKVYWQKWLNFYSNNQLEKFQRLSIVAMLLIVFGHIFFLFYATKNGLIGYLPLELIILHKPLAEDFGSNSLNFGIVATYIILIGFIMLINNKIKKNKYIWHSFNKIMVVIFPFAWCHSFFISEQQNSPFIKILLLIYLLAYLNGLVQLINLRRKK